MPNTVAPEEIVTVRFASAVPTTVASPVTLETTLVVPTLPILLMATVGAMVSTVSTPTGLPTAPVKEAGRPIALTRVEPA